MFNMMVLCLRFWQRSFLTFYLQHFWRAISIHSSWLKCVHQNLLVINWVMFAMSMSLLCWWVAKSLFGLCFLTSVEWRMTFSNRRPFFTTKLASLSVAFFTSWSEGTGGTALTHWDYNHNMWGNLCAQNLWKQCFICLFPFLFSWILGSWPKDCKIRSSMCK